MCLAYYAFSEQDASSAIDRNLGALGGAGEFDFHDGACMRNLPVHWSEGMFLRPHHFQASDRHWAESVSLSSQWDNAYNYGLQRASISPEALSHQQFQVAGLQARLRDGTLFSLDAGEELDRVDLKSAFEKQSVVTVYLATPKLVLGRPNVGASTGAERRRYTPTTLPLQDEATGGNDQEIGLLRLDAKLLLSGQDLEGYETIPVARVKRSGAEEATPELDDDFIPPLLAVDAWPPLALDIVRAVFDIMGEKADVLAGRVTDRGVTLASSDPGDLDDLLMLKALNEGLAVVNCLTFAKGAHPYDVYRELCRVVGSLSLFGSGRRLPADIPAYDHDDLARIFKWVKLRIEQLLGSRKQLEYEQRYFSGAERGMQVTIEPDWLHSGWDWYIGVNAQNIPDAQCRDLLRPGKLDWKMGSTQQVDLIFKHGVPGVEHIELPKAPRGLPGHQGWVFYEVRREGAAWKDVLATQSLALRFRMELIGNLDTLPGQRKLEVILPDKRAILEFALFAVRPRES